MDWVLRLFGQFDSRGLRYSISHLQEIEDDIPYYPLEKMAKYADIVTTRNAQNYNWLMSQVGSDSSNELALFDIPNATAFGNMAYVAIHSPAPFNRKCQQIISDYRKHLNRQYV